MGPSKDDHTEVINHYIKQIEKIRSGQKRYCGLMMKIINTAFDLLTYIADRLEWQSIVHVLKVGKYGLRWGHSSRIRNKIYCHVKDAMEKQLQYYRVGRFVSE